MKTYYFFALVTLLFFACGKDEEQPNHVISYLDDSYKDWFNNDSGTVITLWDNNNSELYEYHAGRIDTDINPTGLSNSDYEPFLVEQMTQYFLAPQLLDRYSYYYTITAPMEEIGENFFDGTSNPKLSTKGHSLDIWITLKNSEGRFYLTYDLDYRILRKIGPVNYNQTSQLNYPEIRSTFKLVDSLIINSKIYKEDLYLFELKDSNGIILSEQITSFYFQKGRGLLQFTIGDGTTFSINK